MRVADSTCGSRLRRMTNTVILAGVWVTAAGFASLSRAEEQPPASPPPVSSVPIPIEPETIAAPGLRLEDLEILALRHNPTLAQAAAAIDQQRGVWQQVGLYPNPQVGYLRTDPNGAGGTRSEGVFVGQEIVTAGKLRRGQAVELQEIRRLETEWQAQRTRVLNDLKVRYYEVLGAQQAVVIAEDLHRLTAEGLSLVDKLLQAQGATRADLLQARIQEQTAQATLDDAKIRHEAGWRQLTAMMGVPQMVPTPLVGRLDDEIPKLDFDGCYLYLIDASPQLRAAKIRIGHAQRELSRERAGAIPNVTVQAITEFDHTTGATNVSTVLSAPLPTFNRNQGNINHAYADIREATAEVQRVRLVLHDQLADTFRRYESARRRVERLQNQVLGDTEENLRLVTDGQRQGEFSLFQVHAARQLYSQTQLAYVDSLTELRKQIVEIDGLLLTGGLNPAALGAAIQTQGGIQQQGLLNQLQERATQQLLPGTIQAIGP